MPVRVIIERFRRHVRRYSGASVGKFAADRAGTIALTTGLMAASLLGIAGLSIDVGNWYFTRRAMQSAVDAAAVAAALEQAKGNSATTIGAAANNDANLNNYGPNQGATVGTVIAGNNRSVTVTISKTASLFLSGLFLGSAPTIQVSAQAGLNNNGGPVCLLTTSPNASGSITLNGNASINAAGCSIVDDSTSASAINANGNASVTSNQTCGPGGVRQNGNVTFTPPPSSCAALGDPLANLPPPPEANNPCQFNNVSFNGNQTATLSPGVYCGGITTNGNSNITFQPGTYVLRGGTFQVNGSANITGNGVGFYLTGSGTKIDLNGNGTVHLSAPTSGPMAGLIVSQDHATTPNSVTHSINGNGNVTYEGTFYFGQENVDINGNGNANSTSPYTMVIANQMTFNGNGTMNFNSNFQNSNVPPPPGMNVNRVVLMQ